MVALSGRNRSWKVQPCIYKSFGDLAVWWTPFKIGHFATQLPDFTYISPNFDRLVWLCLVRMWYPYLQGSNAGQKCLKISRIFKFDVPLWLTRKWSDLVTLQSMVGTGRRRTSTESMEPLTLLVLYLQGSNAGQKCLKISRIFKFDVPLWLTRKWSDLVTTKYGSPIR